MMSKNKALGVIIAASIILTTAGVSAFELNLSQGANQIITWIEEVFGPFLAAIFGTSEQLFERILLFTVLLIVIYLVLGKVPIFKREDGKPKGGIVWVITLAVSLLAMRVTYNFDSANAFLTRLSYSALGVALTAAIPFVIYFFFVYSFERSSTLRKILWAFYLVVFVGIWMSNYEAVGAISWIYFFTAIAALICLLADGTIRRIILKQRAEEANITNVNRLITEYTAQLAKLHDLHRAGHTPSQEFFDKEKARLNREIVRLKKSI
jgi:hypothetical protein